MARFSIRLGATSPTLAKAPRRQKRSGWRAVTLVELASNMVLVLPSVRVAVMNRSVEAGCSPKAAFHLKVRVLVGPRTTPTPPDMGLGAPAGSCWVGTYSRSPQNPLYIRPLRHRHMKAHIPDGHPEFAMDPEHDHADGEKQPKANTPFRVEKTGRVIGPAGHAGESVDAVASDGRVVRVRLGSVLDRGGATCVYNPKHPEERQHREGPTSHYYRLPPSLSGMKHPGDDKMRKLISMIHKGRISGGAMYVDGKGRLFNGPPGPGCTRVLRHHRVRQGWLVRGYVERSVETVLRNTGGVLEFRESG